MPSIVASKRTLFTSIAFISLFLAGVTNAQPLDAQTILARRTYSPVAALFDQLAVSGYAHRIDKHPIQAGITAHVVHFNIGSGRYRGLTHVYLCDANECELVATRNSENHFLESSYSQKRHELTLFSRRQQSVHDPEQTVIGKRRIFLLLPLAEIKR